MKNRPSGTNLQKGSKAEQIQGVAVSARAIIKNNFFQLNFSSQI